MPSPARKLVLILIAGAVVYLIGNARTPLFDRDEPRYAQCSRQMLQSGDWVVPRLYDQVRAKKPPLIYWAQASSMACFGQNAFAARFPSALAMVLTLCVVALSVWKRVSPQHAVWTTLVLSSAALVIALAKGALTDSVLLLWVTIAQVCLYRLWTGRGGWPTVLVMSVAIGLGTLTKGVAAGVCFFTLLALGAVAFLDRRRGMRFQISDHRRVTPLQILVGAGIIVAMVAPWVYLVHHREPQFLSLMFGEAAGHLGEGKEGHGGPPGQQFLMIWGTFLPWTLLLPLALILGWKHRDVPQVRFAFAAVVGPWVMTELVRTKLPQYMLPVFPPLAFLVADAVVRCLRGEQTDLEWRRIRNGSIVWALVVIAICCVPWLLALRFRELPWAVMGAITVGAIGFCSAVLVLFRRGRPAAALTAMGTGSLVLSGLLYAAFFPLAGPLRLSPRAAAVLVSHGETRPGQALMLDFKEPSLAFYQGGTIREGKQGLLTRGAVADLPPWLVITGDVWRKTPDDVRAAFEPVASFRGLAYADGMRVVDVMVIHRR